MNILIFHWLIPFVLSPYIQSRLRVSARHSIRSQRRHKLILVIADGMVKSAGNDHNTPSEVEAHSCVAVLLLPMDTNVLRVFDERMTTFECEFFNSVWRVSGVSPDRYELALCVDADTKVFPRATPAIGSQSLPTRTLWSIDLKTWLTPCIKRICCYSERIGT
jgi:hypothetical protein